MENHCDRIFHGLYIQRNKDESVKIAPCCVCGQSEPQSSPIDFVNDEYLNKLRQNTKNDLRNPECDVCWKYADNGMASKKDEKLTKVDDPTIILSLEYNTLPICNAKCIICGPKFSSLWVADDLKLKKLKLKNPNVIISDVSIEEVKNKGFNYDNLNLSQLEYLYFNGGEPLLTNDHIEVLSKIKNLENLTLCYSSNGSIYPSPETLEYWNKTKTTRVWFSIDAIGDQFNYIRFPLQWEEVKSNIIKLHNNFPNIDICFLFTAGVHNIFEIKKTLDFFYDQVIHSHPTDEKADRCQFYVQLAMGVLDIKYTDKKLKQVFIDELKSIDGKYQNKINYIINYLESTIEEPTVTWQTYLDQLDQIRPTDWKKTLPRLILD
jgi:MoaA/NifB/PqqE/SkfB family radical SAM enzyme